MQQTDQETSRDLAKMAYENAGREITLASQALSVNLTLAAGTLGVALVVAAAGALFSGTAHLDDGIPRLSSISLVLVALAVLLIGRFYIRATFAYQQLARFNLIQKAAWAFMEGDLASDGLQHVVRTFLQQQHAPQPWRRSMWGTLKYGFGGVFAVAVAALAWGFATAPTSSVAWIIALVAVIVSLTWETLTLSGSPPITPPAPAELWALRNRLPDHLAGWIE